MRTHSRIAGFLLAASGLIGISGCQPADKSVTDNAPSDTLPQAGDKSGDEASAVANSLQNRLGNAPPAVEEVLLPDTAEELVRELSHQTSLMLKASDPASLKKILDIRLKAGEKLLRFQLDGEQRFFAVRTVIDTLIRMKILGDPTASENLAKVVNSLAGDTDPRIRELSSVAPVIVDINSRLQQKDQNLQASLDLFSKVARDFPQSSDVHAELYNCADLVLRSGQKETGIRMLEALVESIPDGASPGSSALLSHIRNRIELARLDIDALLERLRGNDPAATEALEPALQRVLKSPSFSLENLLQIAAAIDFMEKNQSAETALVVNRALKSAADSLADPVLQTRLRDLCSLRETRIGLVGNRLTDTLLLADGKVLDPATLEGKRTVIVVWSPSEPASIDFIKKLDELYAAPGQTEWNLLGVCLTRSSRVVRTLFGGKLPEWPCAVPTTDPLALAARFGTTSTPQILMLDEKGRITSSNLAPEALLQQPGIERPR
jgi:hypothetical protein